MIASLREMFFLVQAVPGIDSDLRHAAGKASICLLALLLCVIVRDLSLWFAGCGQNPDMEPPV